MRIRCRLPEIRARAGRIPLRELSRQTGIALSTLSRIDSGKSGRLDLETLLTLCRFFKLQPGAFFEVEFDEGETPFSDLESMPAA